MTSRPKVTVLLTEHARDLVMTDEAWHRLQAVADIVVASGPPGEWDLSALVGDSVACLTGWGTPALNEEILDHAPALGLVAHTAGSVRHLVPPNVIGKRIAVCQSAAVIATSVAEMVVLQMLTALRELHLLDRGMRDGEWSELRVRHPGRLLAAQTVGVVGASRTGRAVIELLRGFGVETSVYDPYLDPRDADAMGVRSMGLDAVLASSDIVTLHAPLLPQTQGLIGAGELDRMHDGALLVNSARAGLVDYDALATELRTGRIAAALDVFPLEPLPVDSEWRTMPNVIISPHSAGHTRDSHWQQGLAMVGEVERHLRGEALHYQIPAEQVGVLA